MAVFSGFEHIVHENEPMTRHTWLRLGGPAQYFAEPTNHEELSGLVTRCRENDLPIRLLGGGSNVLVPDGGVRGLVVHLASPAFCGISVSGHTLKVGSGARLGHVVATSVREGLAGLEELVGIPGTIGGALHGNAGSSGGDIGQWTSSALVLTRGGELLTRSRKELYFAYRESSLDELAILEAQFDLEPADPAALIKRMQTRWIVKKGAEPASDVALACMFKSPGGLRAESLIEEADLKGARVGEAVVSERHANFVVAHGGATSSDVLNLMKLIRARVQERAGVELQPQLDIW